MSDEATTRITIKVRKELKENFLAWTRKFGISKDHFFRTQLPRELEYLRALPANPPAGRKINRSLGIGTERLNISLPAELAQELDALCEEKGLHREIFLDYFLDFLINGDEEAEVESPIRRLEELLENPRSGYTVQAHGNPYRHLYWDEESAAGFEKLSLQLARDRRSNVGN